MEGRKNGTRIYSQQFLRYWYLIGIVVLRGKIGIFFFLSLCLADKVDGNDHYKTKGEKDTNR
jgi:hypothetical protein